MKIIIVGCKAPERAVLLKNAGVEIIELNGNEILKKMEFPEIKRAASQPLFFVTSSFAQQSWRGTGKRRKRLVR